MSSTSGQSIAGVSTSNDSLCEMVLRAESGDEERMQLYYELWLWSIL